MIRLIGAVWLLLAVARAAAAQVLPAGPLRLADGRLIVGAELGAAASTAPDLGFFNYTDYTHNALRLVRVSATADLRLAERIAVLGEIRTENWDRLRAYAIYVRVRPFRARAFDLQAGRVPPVFGAFGRRAYGNGNPLVGYPLAYQYLTSLRADALPASADDLLRMRGRGWLARYPLGNPTPAPGLPLITAFRWDTGIQARWAARRVEMAGAVTNGTLSNPRVRDDNGGKQVAGRLAVQPVVGLLLGVSAARGAFLSRRASAALLDRPESAGWQRALGADVEYSRGHWLLRTELIVSAWRLPTSSSPPLDGALRAVALSLEGRYTLRPGWYVAARADWLTFSRIRGTLFGGQLMSWDAPISRIETVTGFYLQRNLVARVGYQHNWRDGGYRRTGGYGLGQIVYWF